MSATALLRNRKRHLNLPVLTQEMRVRQRGVRPFAVMLLYLLILSAVGLFVINSEAHLAAGDAGDLAVLGQELFAVLAMAQLAMICLIVPAYSAAVVTSEREKGTLELLSLTLLTSGNIVRQKLAAAVAEVLVLAMASLPVVGLVFLLGGVSPLQIALSFVILAATAVFLGAYGVLCSCVFKNTRASTFAAYLSMASFMLLLPFGTEWLKSVAYTGFTQSAETFPFILIGLLLFVGGVGATALFAPVAHILKQRTRIWQIRAFRIAAFGACYIIVFLFISVPSLSNLAIDVLYGVDQDISLPMFVNPFVAVLALVDAFGRSDLATAIVVSTLVFAMLCAYLFVNLSVRRFGILRRS